MAVDEQRLRIRRSIEEKLGVEEAAYLIEGRPSGGWDALVTKEYLDLRLDTVRSEMATLRSDVMKGVHQEINRLLKWMVPTILGSITAGGAALGVAAAIVG